MMNHPSNASDSGRRECRTRRSKPQTGIEQLLAPTASPIRRGRCEQEIEAIAVEADWNAVAPHCLAVR